MEPTTKQFMIKLLGVHRQIYHVRDPLVEAAVYRYTDGKSVGDSFLADALAQIPGVAAVVVRRYEAEVEKAQLFSWDEIDPLVLAALGLESDAKAYIASLEARMDSSQESHLTSLKGPSGNE